MAKEIKFEDLQEKILKKIIVSKDDDNDEIVFTTKDSESYILCHEQDCCEHVYIKEIVGDLSDLIGDPILLAEKVEQHKINAEADPNDVEARNEGTWTFYKLSTIKGSITISWVGMSNGYYSERVDFKKIEN